MRSTLHRRSGRFFFKYYCKFYKKGFRGIEVMLTSQFSCGGKDCRLFRTLIFEVWSLLSFLMKAWKLFAPERKYSVISIEIAAVSECTRRRSELVSHVTADRNDLLVSSQPQRQVSFFFFFLAKIIINHDHYGLNTGSFPSPLCCKNRKKKREKDDDERKV